MRVIFYFLFHASYKNYTVLLLLCKVYCSNAACLVVGFCILMLCLRKDSDVISGTCASRPLSRTWRLYSRTSLTNSAYFLRSRLDMTLRYRWYSSLRFSLYLATCLLASQVLSERVACRDDRNPRVFSTVSSGVGLNCRPVSSNTG